MVANDSRTEYKKEVRRYGKSVGQRVDAVDANEPVLGGEGLSNVRQFVVLPTDFRATCSIVPEAEGTPSWLPVL